MSWFILPYRTSLFGCATAWLGVALLSIGPMRSSAAFGADEIGTRNGDDLKVAATLGDRKSQNLPTSSGHGLVDIQRLIRQLSDSDFQRREDATTQLMAAGPKVIEPVAKAARLDDVETVYRAVRILQSFSDRGDSSIQQQAVAALESLANNGNKSTADLAADALAFYHLTLQDRAIDQLKQLGAAVRQVCDGDAMLINPQIDPLAAEAVLDSRWSGKSENLELLKKIPNLQRLRLVNVSLDRAGLKTIGELSQLKQLDLFGTNVSSEEKQKIEATIAGIAIDYRKGAKLGIAGNRGAPGCIVERVEEESAASDAGIFQDDAVLKLDGKPITSFDEFTALISDKKGGDQIQLEIRRGEETLVKNVTLGSWR